MFVLVKLDLLEMEKHAQVIYEKAPFLFVTVPLIRLSC